MSESTDRVHVATLVIGERSPAGDVHRLIGACREAGFDVDLEHADDDYSAFDISVDKPATGVMEYVDG